jgi:hypothetical protein
MRWLAFNAFYNGGNALGTAKVQDLYSALELWCPQSLSCITKDDYWNGMTDVSRHLGLGVTTMRIMIMMMKMMKRRFGWNDGELVPSPTEHWATNAQQLTSTR